MSESRSVPSFELAAALADEGRRVLMGHWVAASIEPLQRSRETLRLLPGGQAPAARALAIEVLGCLSLALDATGRFDAAASARGELEVHLEQNTSPLAGAFALWSMACAAQLRTDVTAMISLGGRAMSLIEAQDALPMAAAHHALLGWALVMDGEADEGMDSLHACAVQYRRHGSAMGLPWLMATSAEARLAGGEPDDARRDIESAHAALAPGVTAFMHGAAWRVRGNLRWAGGEGLAAASSDWLHALSIDHAAGAPLCELQTLLVMGRALAASGNKALARERLGEVLGRVDDVPPDAACPLLDIARRQLAAWS